MSEKPIPFVAFGNDELEQKPEIMVGQLLQCHRCGGQHEIRPPDGWKPGDAPPILTFFKCGGSAYLASVAMRLVNTAVTPVEG